MCFTTCSVDDRRFAYRLFSNLAGPARGEIEPEARARGATGTCQPPPSLCASRSNYFAVTCGPAAFTMSRHAWAQSLHALAHFAIRWSCECLSHSLAQPSQALMQASHAGIMTGPCRDISFAATAHSSPQSLQVRTVATCIFSPFATISVQ